MKICLTANTGWYLYNFRLSLAHDLRSRGTEVVFVSPRDAFAGKIVAAGFAWRELVLDRASLNPAKGLTTVARLAAIYRRERPDLVHHFTPKIVFFGTYAAELARVPAIVNSVTGLGHVAIDRRIHYRALFAAAKVLYRSALVRRNVRVIFQNHDDFDSFSRLGLVDPARAILVRGSGVDTDRYRPAKVADAAGAPIALFASRLLSTKGIFELVEAARRLKARGVAARYLVCGEPDPGNPASVPRERLEEWRREGIVELLGHVEPIDPLIATASLVVLPSYREGMPKILLEASAMEKPVISTDVPGCREAVDNGVTGLLVPAENAVELERALEKLLTDRALRVRMGKAGRERVVREFSTTRVNDETRAVYDSLVALNKV